MSTFRSILYACVLSITSFSAGAQVFPSGPIRLIVPFAAGGGNDFLARIIAEESRKNWNQPVIVENKPGAGGNIGAEFVARSAPDGHTLLLGTNTLTMAPFITAAMPFDVQKDLAPVAMFVATPFVVVVNPELPVKSISEMIAYAKANPNKLSYATPGVGTPHHLGTELFKSMTGISMVHVPYRGGQPAVTDLIAGRVQVMWLTINAAIPQLKAGKLRAIAVAESARLPSMPDLPTVAESLPGYEVSAWYAIFAPSGTAPGIVAQISTEVQRIFSDPAVLARLTPIGYQKATAGPERLAETIARDLKLWEKVVRDAGIEKQ